MKLNDLHVLMAVVEAGSMNKAALLLHTTQPAISRSIGELERTIGVRLLDRNPRGVEPTEYGRALRGDEEPRLRLRRFRDDDDQPPGDRRSMRGRAEADGEACRCLRVHRADCSRQHGRDPVVGQHRREAVGTQEYHVPRGQARRLDLDL